MFYSSKAMKLNQKCSENIIMITFVYVFFLWSTICPRFVLAAKFKSPALCPRGLSTRTIFPLFTVSSSTLDSSNKTVICEVLLGVRYKYLIFMECKESKDTTIHSQLTFLEFKSPAILNLTRAL